MQKALGLVALIATTLVAINILSWRGVFWAGWPLLALGFLLSMTLVRTQNKIDQRLAAFSVTGITLVLINFLAWNGVFWAIWPILALTVAASLRWLMRK